MKTRNVRHIAHWADKCQKSVIQETFHPVNKWKNGLNTRICLLLYCLLSMWYALSASIRRSNMFMHKKYILRLKIWGKLWQLAFKEMGIFAWTPSIRLMRQVKNDNGWFVKIFGDSFMSKIASIHQICHHSLIN